MPRELKIDDALDRASITIVAPETAEERQHRLEGERARQRYDLFKSYVTFIILLATLLTVGAISLYVGVFDSGAAPDTRRWAQTVLSALLSGALSFVVGQATVKPK